MAEAKQEVLWQESASGETVAAAYQRLTGRELDFGRCQWEEIRGDCSVYHFRDGTEVKVSWSGECSISRVAEGGPP